METGNTPLLGEYAIRNGLFACVLEIFFFFVILFYIENRCELNQFTLSLRVEKWEYLHGVHFVTSQHSSNFTFRNWQRERYMLMVVKLSGEANQDMLEWFGKHFKLCCHTGILNCKCWRFSISRYMEYWHVASMWLYIC